MPLRRCVRQAAAVALAAAAAALPPLVPATGRAEARPTASVLSPLRSVPKLGGRFTDGPLSSTVTVKFREGADLDLAGDRLTVKHGFGASAAARLIARDALPGSLRRTFGDAVGALRAATAKAEATARVDLADLSLYLDVEAESPAAALELARELDALDEVESAYARPAPEAIQAVNAHRHTPTMARVADEAPTPPLDHLQHYLREAPFGLGVLPLRAWLGEGKGRGRGVRIVDVEYSWFLGHEDLPFNPELPGYREIAPFLQRTPAADPQGHHGTANLGILVAVDNGFGMTGICPDADIGIVNPKDGPSGRYDLARAIKDAADALEVGSGDIILVEQQIPGPHTVVAPSAPAEWLPDVFDAIRYATARGLVVVEAASNGPSNLDHKYFQGAFQRNDTRDSGAIIVGAGQPPLPGLINASRVADSTFGSRVDMQGQGDYVASLGTGDIWGSKRKSAPLANRYTYRYGGTSAAATQIAGVAAIVQGVVEDAGLPPLSSQLMRAILAGTGSPDNSKAKRPIGPRPNALAAVQAALSVGSPTIMGVRFSEDEGQFVIDGIYFAPENNAVEIEVDGLEEPLRFGATSLPGQISGWPDARFASRLVTIGEDVATRVPVGTLLAIMVVAPGSEPGTEIRSPRRYFVRRP